MPACDPRSSYVKGIHNLKVGAVYEQTFLDENDSVGIVDPTYLPSLVDANGLPCFVAAASALDAPCTNLASLRPDAGRRAVWISRRTPT